MVWAYGTAMVDQALEAAEPPLDAPRHLDRRRRCALRQAARHGTFDAPSHATRRRALITVEEGSIGGLGAHVLTMASGRGADSTPD